MEALSLRRIEPGAAVAALAGIHELDPRGISTPQDVQAWAEAGECFELAGSTGSAVYVISVQNGCAWVQAVKGSGGIDLVSVLDEVGAAQAQGLQAMGCQTARPGLVKKLKARGWRVTGWIMRKELKR